MRALLFTKLLTVGRLVPLVDELVRRGAEVTIALPMSERDRPRPELPVPVELYDEFEDAEAGSALNLLRRARDYAWYLRPEHRAAAFNRRRALERLVRAASGKRRGA